MKEKMLEYLNREHWTSGRDADVIEDFIKSFFDQYQADRLNPEDIYYRNEDGTYPPLKVCINICDSQNCENK